MKFQVKAALNPKQKSDALIVLLQAKTPLSKQLKSIQEIAPELVKKIGANKKFTADFKQIQSIELLPELNTERLVLLGVGEKSTLSKEHAKQLANTIATHIKSHNIHNAQIDINGTEKIFDNIDFARYLVESIGDKQYVHQTQPKAKKQSAKKPIFKGIIAIENKKTHSKIRKAIAVGIAINNGKNLTKELGNLPGNICTPSYLANTAKKLARSHGLKVKILSEKEMEKLKMRTLLSVSKGSREQAKLVIMEHWGAKDKKQAPHVLVGKGLTFDAGGISIKPSARMDEMKYDMCGGGSVFGTMLAAAELNLPINLVGIVPCSENLPDGQANKPGDVIQSMAGLTVEILNTDAEGRLILCDALTYAERYKPKSVIDIATLTGAALVALGHQTAALMGNNQKLIDRILDAGQTSLDYAWQLPLNDSYKVQLKSDYADLANIGGATAGTITAGCFLSCFTEKYDWAHLDIAGTAWGGSAGKRATGRAVPILTQYLIDVS